MDIEAGLRGWVDAHIHIDKYEPEERDALLEEAYAAGGDAVVAVSVDLASCKTNRELAARHAGRYMPAYGYHPEQPVPSERDEAELFAWIRARHAEGERFAIGEVGLPYYARSDAEANGRPFDERGHLALLGRFAALAAELDRPIALHAVYEDADKACAIMEEHGVRRAHFHWFKGSEETVRRLIANGYYVSIAPDVTYEADIQALVRSYPLDLLMAETDGPWPHEGPFAGRPTKPGMAAAVIRAIAELKGITVREAAETIRGNTRRFYGI